MRNKGEFMLIEELKKANMEALKEHNNSKRTAYSTAINKYMLLSYELKAQGKEATDADMVGAIQKTIKELIEEKEGYEKANRPESVADINVQQEALEKFLPKMMSLEEIEKEINKLDDKSIGSVMKHFKLNFAGKVDMRDVQTVLHKLA